MIRFAETDDDVIAIHRFLLVVAQPAMMCPVNVEKSLHEIIRVTKYEAAIMAIKGDMLVGTMGLMRPTWWYGDADFLTDRWHFVLPDLWHSDANKKLLGEAKAIAREAGLNFIHQGKIRKVKDGTFLMFPRLHEPESATVEQTLEDA